jgi:hypothetical protein
LLFLRIFRRTRILFLHRIGLNCRLFFLTSTLLDGSIGLRSRLFLHFSLLVLRLALDARRLDAALALLFTGAGLERPLLVGLLLLRFLRGGLSLHHRHTAESPRPQWGDRRRSTAIDHLIRSNIGLALEVISGPADHHFELHTSGRAARPVAAWRALTGHAQAERRPGRVEGAQRQLRRRFGRLYSGRVELPRRTAGLVGAAG